MEFGRYKVIEQLGAGAMGEVFKATDTRVHDRVVAVKVLIDRLSRNEQAVRRFETEVKTAATLSHPNIIAIQDRGEAEDGRPFFVMEYLDGHDLKLYTSGQEELSLARRIELGGQVADALDYAHERGVVHRDVKPSNIFVVKHGEQFQAKLLDFGIVHVEGSDLTQTTDQPGTSNYMAPEVLKGSEATIQSDLFSLGIVLYELFTFVHPFQASTQALILSRIMHEEPDRPRRTNPEIPHQLEAMILQLLEKEPDDRPPRAKEIAEALRGIVSNLRSTGVAGTPSDFSSADEMTGQAIRSFVDRARRFESEGDLEEALKLRKQALALAPDNPKLKRKVETLTHDIQRRSRIESLLSSARAELKNGQLEAARAAFDDAWLITRDDARVLDFKARLELAEAQRGIDSPAPQAVQPEPLLPEPEPEPEPEAQTAPQEAISLHTEFVNALNLHYHGAGKDQCRQLLTGYLRNNPGDTQAVQALADILAGRDPNVFGYDPPPAWTDEERKRLAQSTEKIRKVAVLGRDEPPKFRESVASLEADLKKLSRGLADPARLAEVESKVEQATLQVVSVVQASVGQLGQQLAEALRIGGVAIAPELRTSTENVISKLQSVDEAHAMGAAATWVVQAAETKEQIDRVLEETHSEIRQQIGRVKGERAEQLGRRISSWRSDSEESLGLLLTDTNEAIASEIDVWAQRVEGTRAFDEQALRKLEAVAGQLRSAAGGAASRSRVGVDAVDALQAAHAVYLEVLEGEHQKIAADFEALVDELEPEEAKALRSFLGESLPLRLSEALRLIETAQGMLEAAQRNRMLRIEAQVESARSVLDDPWLEAEVAAIERATTESDELLARAGAARAARDALRGAMGQAESPTGDLEDLIANARSTAAASRDAHHSAQQHWSDQSAALEGDLAQLTDRGMPERVRQRASRIRLPESTASDPAGIRTFVQAVSRGSRELGTLLSKVAKLVPTKRREAESLLTSLNRKGGGFRFPRIPKARRHEIVECRGQLETLLDEKELTLAEIVPAIKHAKKVIRAIPINLVPWLALAGVAIVVSSVVWFVIAPREVRIVAGLAVADIRMSDLDETAIPPSDANADGIWTFRVRPGDYKIWYLRVGDTTPHGEEVLEIPLTRPPAPLSIVTKELGDSYPDRIKNLVKKKFPDLFP